MTTTLTIDPVIAQQLEERMVSKKLGLEEVINQTLAAGLEATKEQAPVQPAFKVEPFSSGFMPGINPDKLNQLLDEMDVEEFAKKYNR